MLPSAFVDLAAARYRCAARECGPSYRGGSEYAFGKAFKREYGTAPGQYRKSADDLLLAGVW